MGIISKSIYTIDHRNENVISRDIPIQFMSYIQDLILFVDRNPNIKNYKVRSEATQVVMNIKNIIRHQSEECIDIEDIKLNNKEIAERLLLKEKDVQVVINRMGREIKKGSLLQVLLKDDENDRYQYVIAKVDHNDFIDDNDLTRKIGFSANNKDIGKICIIETVSLDIEQINIDNARIYLDSPAKYWADDFLELEEMMDDEKNTSKVFKYVQNIFSRFIKSKSPSDFTILRNSLIGKLRSGEHINYFDMIDELIGNYEPEMKEVLSPDIIGNIINLLKELPEKRGFDTQFTAVPSAIKAKIKQNYPVRTGVEISINDHVKDFREVITSWEDDHGIRYITIEATNTETYNLFKKRDAS